MCSCFTGFLYCIWSQRDQKLWTLKPLLKRGRSSVAWSPVSDHGWQKKGFSRNREDGRRGECGVWVYRGFLRGSLGLYLCAGRSWNQRKKGLLPWLAGAHYSLFHGLWFNACLTGFFFSSWLLISFCQLYILMCVFMEIFIVHMLHIKHHHKAFLLQSCWNKWCYYYNNFIGLYLFCNEKDLWLLEPSAQAGFTAFWSYSDLMELLKLLKCSISQLRWAHKAEWDRRNRTFAWCHAAWLIPDQEASIGLILHTMVTLYFIVHVITTPRITLATFQMRCQGSCGPGDGWRSCTSSQRFAQRLCCSVWTRPTFLFLHPRHRFVFGNLGGVANARGMRRCFP